MTSKKWHLRFLRTAQMIASWSKHPTTKVGCVIFSDDKVQLSGGYNGHPRGVSDESINVEEFSKTVHAEANAVANAARIGLSLKGGTAYITHAPCVQCAALLIQVGVKSVIYDGRNVVTEKYFENVKTAIFLLRSSGVVVSTVALSKKPVLPEKSDNISEPYQINPKIISPVFNPIGVWKTQNGSFVEIYQNLTGEFVGTILMSTGERTTQRLIYVDYDYHSNSYYNLVQKYRGNDEKGWPTPFSRCDSMFGKVRCILKLGHSGLHKEDLNFEAPSQNPK